MYDQTPTYTECYRAVEELWPNVTDIDWFLEQLTSDQIVVIYEYVIDRGRSLDYSLPR